MADHNALVITFTDRSKSYEAYSTLKQLAVEDRLVLRGAQLVTRSDDGHLNLPEGVDTDAGSGTWGGGLIGLIIGILGGPIGMLFGWTSGMLIGGAFDLRREDRQAGILGEISAAIPVGGNAIVAEVEEFAEEVVDGAMLPLGGVVWRKPAGAVLAELETAEDAYREAKKEAERRAREERRAERKENWDERVATLKEKVGLS